MKRKMIASVTSFCYAVAFETNILANEDRFSDKLCANIETQILREDRLNMFHNTLLFIMIFSLLVSIHLSNKLPFVCAEC